MNDRARQGDSLRKIDEVCDAFEKAIAITLSGDAVPPSLQEYVARVDEADQELAVEMLLALDQHYGGKAKQQTDYLEELAPEHHAAVMKFFSSAESPMTESFHSGEASAETLPSQIGPYKVLRRIGFGGMGEVYLAEQTSPVRRQVALKVIKAGLDTKDVVARFEAERQALAMMDHQNIAKVLDLGVTDDGQLYFAMEYVQGIPITEYCDKYKLSLNDRLVLFGQVCRAIQHSHQKGVIHRDLKPSNVLVTRYDDVPVVKVIDFGLAKALQWQTRLTDKTLVTRIHQVLGTWEYMSPEQAKPDELGVDTRTDVYSLGVLLYELLTGSTPLESQRINELADYLKVKLICEDEAPRPSARLSDSGDAITGISDQRQIDPRQLSLKLKDELDWIAVKALEKDRVRRYDGAGALADDVQRYLEGEPIEARPPSVSYRLQKAVHKHKAVFITGSVIVLLLVAGLAATGILWQLWKTEAVQARLAEDKAIQATQTTKQHLNRLNREVAHSAFINGLHLCEQDRIQAGLLWFSRSLETPVDDPAVKRAIVENIFHWGCELIDAYYHRISVGRSPFRPGYKELVHEESVIWLNYTPDGRSLLTATISGEISVWDSFSGKTRSDPLHLGKPLLTCCYDPSSNSIFAASPINTVTRIHLGNMTSSQLVTLSSPILKMDFSHNTGQLVVGSQNGSVSLLDCETGIMKPLCHEGEAAVTDVAINQRGSLAIAGFTDGKIRIWDLSTNLYVVSNFNHTDTVHDIAIHPGGMMAASGGEDGQVFLMRIDEQGVHVKTLYHESAVTSVTFTTNGNSLLTGCDDRSARMWNIQTGELQGVPFDPDFIQTPLDQRRPLEHFQHATQTVRITSERPVFPEGMPFYVNRYLPFASVSSSQETLLMSGFGIGNISRLWCARLHKPLGPEVSSGKGALVSDFGTVDGMPLKRWLFKPEGPYLGEPKLPLYRPSLDPDMLQPYDPECDQTNRDESPRIQAGVPLLATEQAEESQSPPFPIDVHLPAALQTQGNQFAIADGGRTVFLQSTLQGSERDVAMLRQWVTILTCQSLQNGAVLKPIKHSDWKRVFNEFQKSASDDLPLPKQIGEMVTLNRMRGKLWIRDVNEEEFVTHLWLRSCTADDLANLTSFSRLRILTIERFVKNDRHSLIEIAAILRRLDSLEELEIRPSDHASRTQMFLQEHLPELTVRIGASPSPSPSPFAV